MNDTSQVRQETDAVVFLSHAWEDNAIARKIARRFFDEGVETFYDEWELRAGDSIREKVDAGLGRCTHFVVLLTPHSLEKSWVRAEMDAAFVQRVAGSCRFIPVRYHLPVNRLPPLLLGIASHKVDDSDASITKLVEAVRGVTERPHEPTGEPRRSSAPMMGLSRAASEIVRLFVERSRHGLAMDPQLRPEDMRAGTKLSNDAIREGAEELLEKRVVRDADAIGQRPLGFLRLFPEEQLFAFYDGYFKPWVPADDAVRMAADLVNEGQIDIPLEPKALAERYGWEPRRLNPAIAFLEQMGAARTERALATAPYGCFSLWITAKAPRFVRDREPSVAVMNLIRSRSREILEIAKRHKAYNPRIFGSTLRGDRRGDSDIDILVSLKPHASLADLGRMKEELEDLLHASVDVVDEKSLRDTLRVRVLSEAKAI